jgi:hypothetical protein
MYVNRNMRPAETIPGVGGGRIKRMIEGMNSSLYLIYCKNFCKCHKVLLAQLKI